MANLPPCDSETYGRLVRATRVWAVAAVHGEAERLSRLQAILAGRLAVGDRLVYLGDYLGYGPDPAAALDQALLLRRAVLAQRNMFLGDVVFLRGGQEEMWQKLMELQFAPNPREVLGWMLEHGIAATLDSYGVDRPRGIAACREGAMAITRWTASIRAAVDAHPGHRQLLSALRRAAFTEPGADEAGAGGLLFVNTGVDPRKPVDLQRDVFWWGGRTDLLELDAPFAGFRRVIAGYHPRHAGVAETPFAVSLDAGCGFGGKLIAACFDTDGRLADQIEA